MKKLLLGFVLLLVTSVLGPQSVYAEFRSAKDMQKECRVALDVVQKKLLNNDQNMLFAGECIGYIQGTVDASQALAENISWYKVCTPDNVSTLALIAKFIDFVDKNPKYTLASTAVQMMLLQEYPCKR